MLRRILTICALLACLSVLGSWVAMERPATGFSDLAADLAPEIAEALPPSPGLHSACVLHSGTVRNQTWQTYKQICWDGPCEGSSSNPDPACVQCLEDASGAADFVAGWDYQICIGEPNTYCSATNPWCWGG